MRFMIADTLPVGYVLPGLAACPVAGLLKNAVE
jgi:hypothetical protein